MDAVYCQRPDPADPLAALRFGERPQPAQPVGWTTVRMRAASLNMRDIATLRGIGVPAHAYPLILGNDGAGVLADGSEVVVHASVGSAGWTGPEARDPDRMVLGSYHQGTFAGSATIPRRNAVPKPPELSFAEAACLPTAWLTAYRMLFVTAGIRAGQTIVVRGRRGLGSIATALIALAAAAGVEVCVRADAADHALARRSGAAVVTTADQPLPSCLDAAFDAGIDVADWWWPIEVLRPGAPIVCSGYRAGAITGFDTVAAARALHTLIFAEHRLVGSGMGTAEDLAALMDFLVRTGLRPSIAHEFTLRDAATGFRAMLGASVAGKIVFRIA
ncbi:quinone oxidoreductase family protein [Nocardia vulneris]|uniref:Alcohol dehydrogenase n=1 Tax=Nocardia vulneris TaxID=1141657 RepID=A0ABR4ZJ58_9NOCA|nr:alcohol dehydrogenase [Nocardia vulneris]KIA65437.1 alcohol dehydrogenase [Nocardia vulneris]